MTLQFLDFDYSEDDEGTATWDALAYVQAQRLPALLQEVCTVLGWAHAEFGTVRGPVELGGLWDYDLQCECVGAPLQALRYDAGSGLLEPMPHLAAGASLTLALSISAGEAFSKAFLEHFPPA